MRPRTKLGTLLVLVILATTAGCTNSDPTTTGNVPLTIDVVVTNAGTRFDQLALVDINAVNVRPNDPLADQALGSAPIGLITSAADILNVDLNEGAEFEPTNLVLSSGSWRVNRIELNNVLLVSTNTAPQANCADFFFFASSPPAIPILAVNLGSEANFTVDPNSGTSRVVIEIDAAAFVTAFTTSWNCSAGNPPVPLTLNRAAFQALAPTFISIQEVSLGGESGAK